MLSEEAKKVIAGMKASWKSRKPANPEEDPYLAAVKAVYAERAAVDDPKRVTKVPDRISVIPEMADGVYGEWLKYLDRAPEKIGDKVILFLHGGGYQTGSCLSRREMAANIGVRAHMDTFIINYRLAPENPYPAALDDCVTAYLWLVKKGYHPWNITVVGESAGAGLTLSMCHFLRDHDLPLPGRIVPFSSPAHLINPTPSRFYNLPYDAMLGADVSEDVIAQSLKDLADGKDMSRVNLYVTKEQADSPYASPVMGTFEQFPKTLLECGEKELLYDDSVQIYEKMKADGADVTLHAWEGLFHVFALLPMPEADQVCEEIAAFARGE